MPLLSWFNGPWSSRNLHDGIIDGIICRAFNKRRAKNELTERRIYRCNALETVLFGTLGNTANSIFQQSELELIVNANETSRNVT